MARRVVSWIVSVILVLYLFLWPALIEPVDWAPEPVPLLEGPYAENRVLEKMELFETPDTHGPEDVAVASDGRVYVGVEEGKILRFEPVVFAETEGRPLGLDFDVHYRTRMGWISRSPRAPSR